MGLNVETPHLERVDASPDEVPALLATPPWRQPKVKVKAPPKLSLQAPELPPQVRWPEYLVDAAALVPQAGTEDEQLSALGVDSYRQSRHKNELNALRQALAARDADAVVLRLGEFHKAWDGRDYPLKNLYGLGAEWLKLGELALPLWNRMASNYYHHGANGFVPALGVAGLPAMTAWASRSLLSAADLMLCFGAQALAPIALAAAFGGNKQLASKGKAWLRSWPAYAVATHLPDALGGKGKAQTQAESMLLWLAGQGLREAVLTGAARFDAPGSDTVQRATLALLDQDPLARFPARIAELPEFWDAASWRHPPVLMNGKTLPVEAVNALGEMLSFPRIEGRYAGLAQVTQWCTPESLDAFAVQIFETWTHAGAPSKHNWAFTSLAIWGSDATARDIEQRVRRWPTEGLSARAAMGLEVLADMGSDQALRCIAAIAERVKSRPLKDKAQDMMASIGLARGLSAQDLEDRLVPHLGLNARGERVLDFGPRQFLLSLDESLKPKLRVLEGGKPGAAIAKLPAVGARDDAELAREATAQFKLIVKQTKAVATSQIRRMEKAMREQRRWSREDFEQVYVRHPLLRQLVSRLVWGVYAPCEPQLSQSPAGDRLVDCFRISAEGEWTNADDTPFAWPDHAHGLAPRVGVLHPLQTSAEQLQAFGQLLADYELLQPFAQLGREVTRGLTPDGQAAHFQAWVGKLFEPLKVLGLESRGWTSNSESGLIYEYTRQLPGQMRAGLLLTPGIELFSPRDSGVQMLTLTITKAGGADVDVCELDAITASELLRDLAEVHA